MNDIEEIINKEKNEIFKNWLDLTMSLLTTADETQLFQIKNDLILF